MSGELVWAVTDGPAGTHAVALPEDRAGARGLRQHYRGVFWCSRAAGGCGGRLELGAGARGRPVFRHADDRACRLVAGGADGVRAYEHLRYERPLTAWLTGQGHRPLLRRLPSADGGTDLQVVVDGLGCALEVQLSPLSDVAWRDRDDAARAQVREVTWLYGPAADTAAATEASVRGVSASLRRHATGLDVGVRDADDRTRWVRLAVCRVTADGFWAPGLEEARARHARRTEEREQAARRAAHRDASSAGAKRSSRRPPAESVPLPFPG